MSTGKGCYPVTYRDRRYCCVRCDAADGTPALWPCQESLDAALPGYRTAMDALWEITTIHVPYGESGHYCQACDENEDTYPCRTLTLAQESLELIEKIIHRLTDPVPEVEARKRREADRWRVAFGGAGTDD